jgi:hypothetical protein
MEERPIPHKRHVKAKKDIEEMMLTKLVSVNRPTYSNIAKYLNEKGKVIERSGLPYDRIHINNTLNSPKLDMNICSAITEFYKRYLMYKRWQEKRGVTG